MELPKIEFVEADLESLLEESKSLVESILGRSLSRADPITLLLKSFLSIIVQQRELINDLARQNLLAYARGDNLEHFGVLVGVERLQPQAASCHAEIKLSAARNKTVIIKKGTRFNAGDNINFALDEDVTFLAGETSTTVGATCLETGDVGNGYKIGELNKIVDPQPFLSSIKNITVPEGGSDLENDDSYRERIRQAPESFSVAGSKGAYIFWTKTYSNEIIDVNVDSPTPGLVDVYFITNEGVPGTEMIQGVQNYLSADNIRPLTDYVTVKPPEVVNYDIEVRYYISRENQTTALTIQNAVENAVTDYINWQKNKLGRDLNPTELTWRMRSAGCKRVEVLSPTFTKTYFNQVAEVQNIKIQYAGLEDA